MARADVSALTPRQSQGAARMTEMLLTARAVHGDAFGAVVWGGVQARLAMMLFDAITSFSAPQERRNSVAQQIMECVRQMATELKLGPGQLAEALRHAKVVYREGFER